MFVGVADVQFLLCKFIQWISLVRCCEPKRLRWVPLLWQYLISSIIYIHIHNSFIISSSSSSIKQVKYLHSLNSSHHFFIFLLKILNFETHFITFCLLFFFFFPQYFHTFNIFILFFFLFWCCWFFKYPKVLCRL